MLAAPVSTRDWWPNTGLEYIGIPCEVEVASEYRYRRHAPRPGTLVVTISQSGETADTLAALEEAKRQDIVGSMVICNVPESSLVRESDLTFMTHAGPEVGVAATKTFTTAMTGLILLALVLSRHHGFDKGFEAHVVRQLRALPSALEDALAMEAEIAEVSRWFGDKQHALFLGRGAHYPVALEGALKLKEISYVHAEAYPAGELKHGPLALVDEEMPVVVVAPNDQLLEKLKSNMEEVRARGGRLYVFSDPETDFRAAGRSRNYPGDSIRRNTGWRSKPRSRQCHRPNFVHYPAATPGVPRGIDQGYRRGQTPQSSQVGNGGVVQGR